MRYIGCKTLLLDPIRQILEEKAPDAKTFCDIFSGTATVARYFKSQYEVYSNDLLYFSYVLQKATVENDAVPTFEGLKSQNILDPIQYLNDMQTDEMETLPRTRRFFQYTYAPSGGRMYLTDENALRIDYARNLVETWKNAGLLQEMEYYYLIACIVEGIPYISNISGTYGAYHKTWDLRSHKQFALYRLDVPSNGKQNKSFQMDGVSLLETIQGDILCIDPPYNARQYLPNYHVLETAAKYDFPPVRGKTGQRPYGNAKSDFCTKEKALIAFTKLMHRANFKHILLSYSTEGIMPIQKIEAAMKEYGRPETFQIYNIPYRRYKSHKQSKTNNLQELLVYIAKE